MAPSSPSPVPSLIAAVAVAAVLASSQARIVDVEMTTLVDRLWQLDVNGCQPPSQYVVSRQGRVSSSGNVADDLAPSKLFSMLREDIVLARPTYQKFVNLLDNYEADTGVAERVTTQELAENSAFLDAVINTKVMQEAQRFLVSKGKASSSTAAFKQLLLDTWFQVYKRKSLDRYNNSCAFEHIFVGETESNNVLGFHNWLAFYLREKSGSVNYLGYHSKGTAADSQQLVLTARFIVQGRFQKPVGSFFLGTSPEFEMALYTTCFLMNKGSKISLTINGTAIDMTVHRLGQFVGTIYPSQP